MGIDQFLLDRCQVLMSYSFNTYIMVTSVNTHFNSGHQLMLIRRGLATLSAPIADPDTDYHELFTWAEDLTSMNQQSLKPFFKHGHRVCYIRVLGKTLHFGFNSAGHSQSLIYSHSHTKVDITEQEKSQVKKFHPKGYSLPTYPTVTCTAIPEFAGRALKHDPPCTLLFVRGVGENHDAHNILIPLVIDNVLLATQLQLDEVFALPIVIQASPKLKKDNLTVLLEENVIAIMYDPTKVTTERKNRALHLLGLADSSVEYIADVLERHLGRVYC
jgi:hypothetical protein